MSRKHKKTNNRGRWVILAAMVLCLAAVCAAVAWMLAEPRPMQPGPTRPSATAPETESVTPTPTAALETKPVRLDAVEAVSINLGAGLRITDVGQYTGVYMEDGSDELVSGILMIAVTNEGDQAVRFAEIAMPAGDATARFSLTTLPPGGTVILLELSRMAYGPGNYTTAVAENVVLFEEPLDCCGDRLKLQILDGAINITNISGSDLSGDIVIYYKNSAADLYYGGITYRVRLEGGLKAGELRQIMADHFSAAGSAILFVTCGES